MLEVLKDSQEECITIVLIHGVTPCILFSLCRWHWKRYDPPRRFQYQRHKHQYFIVSVLRGNLNRPLHMPSMTGSAGFIAVVYDKRKPLQPFRLSRFAAFCGVWTGSQYHAQPFVVSCDASAYSLPLGACACHGVEPFAPFCIYSACGMIAAPPYPVHRLPVTRQVRRVINFSRFNIVWGLSPSIDAILPEHEKPVNPYFE